MKKYNTDVRASSGARFGEYIIDCICIVVFNFIFLFVIGIIMRLTHTGMSFNDPGFKIMYYIIYFLIFFMYYYILEYYTGITLGKLITDTRVVNIKGLEPTSSEVCIRTLCRLIPFDAFSFFGDRGWHDSISNTLVIKNVEPEITLE